MHTFNGPLYPKNKKHLKKRHDDVIITFFLGIYYFWGTVVYQTYAVWVLIGCKIKFCIQQVPTQHTFDQPHYPKNKKYLKKCDDDVIVTFFQVFLFSRVVGSIKSMLSGYSLDADLILPPMTSPY